MATLTIIVRTGDGDRTAVAEFPADIQAMRAFNEAIEKVIPGAVVGDWQPRPQRPGQVQLFVVPDPEVPRKPKTKAELRKWADGEALRVFEYLDASYRAAAHEVGRKQVRGLSPTKHTLGKIAARIIDNHSDVLPGPDACMRVIDVAAADARRAGNNPSANGWKYFGSQLFTYADAFAAKLSLWSEDGNHGSFGDPRAGAKAGSDRLRSSAGKAVRQARQQRKPADPVQVNDDDVPF